MKFKISALLTLSVLAAANANAAPENLRGISIYGNSRNIVYSPMPFDVQNPTSINGYAYVNYEMPFAFKKGLNTITIPNLPELIDNNSLSFNKLGQAIKVVEQSIGLKASDISIDNGRQVTIEQIAGDKIIERKGRLISMFEGFTPGEIALLTDDNKILLINNYTAISYDKPEKFDITASAKSNLQARSSASLVVDSSTEGNANILYSFRTGGISWVAEYRVNIADSTKDVGVIEGWANIANYSGLDYASSNLKLVAGEINASAAPIAIPAPMMAKSALREAAVVASDSFGGQAFSSASMGDLQTYSIDRLVELPNKTIKKIKLFDDKPNVKFTRQYLVEDNGIQNADIPVAVNLNFINNVESGLGNPLPAGKVKIFEADKDGNSQFAGESQIDNSTINDEIDIKPSNAFDIKVKKTTLNSKNDNANKTGSFESEYAISNQKDRDIKVLIRAYIYQQNWQISGTTVEFKKLDNNRVEFEIPVKANSKDSLKFKVDYTY